MKKVLFIASVLLCVFCLYGCAAEDAPAGAPVEPQTAVSQTDEPAAEDKTEGDFAVTSENLVDGVWDVKTTNTKHGENLSPQLSWEAVDGAACYAVYIFDEDTVGWMHMKHKTTGTSLDMGAVPSYKETEDKTGYVGPYPPSGTHEYVVYVLALSDADSVLPGTVDSINLNGINRMIKKLDTTDNVASGNIIAIGQLSGTYTAQ